MTERGDGADGADEQDASVAELETLARQRLPVVVVVFDDATLSLIAAKQRPHGDGGEAAVSYGPVDPSSYGGILDTLRGPRLRP